MKLFTKDINNKLFKQFQSGNDLDNQRVVAKIFNPYGKGRWFLVNSDPQDPDYLWAIVQMGDIVEVGSVLRSELESIRVSPFRFPLERDLGFSEVNAGELLRGLDKGKFYKEGGSVEYAGGGMTAGRWYRDNTGVEYRYIGENSQGQLLFSDGEKTIVRDEEDFNSVPEEKKLFGIFKEGGTLSMDDYEMNDDRWFLIENGMILKGKLTQPAARKAADVLSKKNPNKKYSVTWIEDYESDDNYEEGGDIINNQLNIEVKKMAVAKGLTPKDLGREYELNMAQAVVASLSDANFHSEAKKLVSILEKKDWNDTLYKSEYFNGTDKVEDFGRKVAAKAKWDGVDISNAFEYVLKMNGFSPLAAKINKAMQEDDNMAKGGKLDTYEVELAAAPNVDYDEDNYNGYVNIKKHKKKVSSIDEAILVVRNFISENDLGGGNWTGGDVYKDGKKIGAISYNGRYWEGGYMAKGGETEPFSKTGKGKFVSTEDRLNICSQQLFDKNYSDCTKDERNKAFDLFLDKYAISYSSKRKMAKGGDLYDDMDEDIKFANKKVRMVAKSLDGLGFNVLEINDADYDTNANIVLSKDTNVDIGLDGEMSIVIDKGDGKFLFIDCKKSYATLLQKLKDVDPKYLPKRNGVDSIKLTLSKKDSYDYIYTQDGTKNSITFAFGKGAFQFDVKKISPELEKYEQDILDAFVIQGIKQHDYKGGFTEAIQHLDTKVVQEANNNLETGGELDWGEDLGDGFSVGNDVYINDRNSRFYDRTGYVIGKLGQSLVIRVGDDEMDAVVKKNGVERLEAPEFAKGGNVNSDLSDKELKDLVERLSKEKTLDKREDYALMKAKYMLEKRGSSSKMADGGMVTLYDDYDKSAGYILEKGNKYWTGKNWSDVKAYAESYKTKQEAEKKLKSTKMAKGGETQDGVDLFEDYDNIPTKVSKILEKYDFEDSTYDELKKVNKELEKIGYTFEYGLDGTAYDLRKIGQKGKSEDEYAKGGEITPYIIWVSKDGEKRELFGQYKSKRAADMQMNKLWEKGEYKSMGNKPKSMYEKEGFYAKGGEMKQNYIVKLLDALRLAMKRSEGNRWYTHGTIVSLKGYDKMSLNYLIPNDYPISDKYRVGLEAKLSYKKDNVEYNYEFSTKNKEKSESNDNARKITWIYMPLTQDVAKQIYNQLEKQGDIKELETWSMENSYEKGGKVTFQDKVKSIKASLLKTKKVPKKVQKDYGKTYNAKEAELAAKRITGAMLKKKNMKKGGTIQDEYDKLRKIEHDANKSYYRARNTINWFEGIGGNYNLKWDKQIEKLKKLDGFEPKYDFGDVIA